MKTLYLATTLGILVLGGCANIGPQSVPRDRFNYNAAIADSWKEQTLLNIVKLRYADMPLFVEVASVVSGYALESSVNLSGTTSSERAVQGDFLALGGSGKFTDRPTITYAPITGQQFNRNFMTPIPPGAVLFLIANGWPADLILSVTVDSINGLRNQVSGGLNQRTGDSGFYRALQLMRSIQKTGAVGMRVMKGQANQETTVLFFHRQGVAPEIRAAMQELSELLGLEPAASEISVAYGAIPSSQREIALLTRSMLQLMIELSVQVEVPPGDIADGRTIPGLAEQKAAGSEVKELIRIHSSSGEPEDAYTAVRYRDQWFWIDDRDFASKRTFAFLMILFSLTESGGKEGLPLVTIPAG